VCMRKAFLLSVFGLRGMLRNVLIRRLEAGDLEFTYRMVSREQWNDRKAELERMLEYEPDGCFIAKVSRVRAGHVFQ
jgi:hypothetical protein